MQARDNFRRKKNNLKIGDWKVKFIHLGLVFFVAVLGGCSTHYYTFDDNVVTISLKHPTAKTMLFADSLDGYEGHELKQRNGLWEVTHPTDKPFSYFYIVDGEIYLPPCPLQENNDFGSKNCIFEPEL